MLFKKYEKIILKVEGMMCAHCTAHVENAIKALDGTKKACAKLESGTVEIEYDSEKINAEQMIKAVEAAGYKAAVAEL